MNPSDPYKEGDSGTNILNLVGILAAVEVVPTAAPRKFQEQIVVVSGGGSTRAYIYDTGARAWKFTQLS